MEQPNKNASSQAAWALLTEGVTRSRLEAHRIRHLVERALKLVEGSDNEDHLYQIAGDIIIGLPQRLTNLETALDRTSLALSKMGEEYLESRIPLSDKALVEDTLSAAFGRAVPRHSLVRRVADRYMRMVSDDD